MLPAAVSQYLSDVALGQGDETSAEYRLFFPRQLPPRDFMLQLSLVYSMGAGYFTKQFFNETIQIIEEPTLLDTQLLGLYLIGAALLAAAGQSAPPTCRGGAGAGGCEAEGCVRGGGEGKAEGGSMACRPAVWRGARADRTRPALPLCAQSTLAPSLPRARAGSRRASPRPAQVLQPPPCLRRPMLTACLHS